MTVRELIVQLMAQPQDADVVVNAGKNELANGMPAKVVRLAKTIVYKEDGWCRHTINYYPEQPLFLGESASEAVNITA